jgi:hypothetical protein
MVADDVEVSSFEGTQRPCSTEVSSMQHPILVALEGGAGTPVTGREALEMIAEVIDSCLPRMSPNDPVADQLRALRPALPLRRLRSAPA